MKKGPIGMGLGPETGQVLSSLSFCSRTSLSGLIKI